MQSFVFSALAGAAPLVAHAEPDSQLQVGEPSAIDNVTLFPLFGPDEKNVGQFTTLEAALAKGDAEVREVGEKPRKRGARSNEQSLGTGAQVNALVLENRGKTAIYVLAGTVVKGGQQDRQIGQDFIVEPKRTVAVDAFCVEHGRWTVQRGGKSTHGKFGAAKALAVSDVRVAGQYKQDQGEVWNQVSEVNRVHNKSADTGTLMATLDDGEVEKRSRTLAHKLEGALGAAQGTGKLIGFAYALDGQMKSVRWFANSQVFSLFRDSLVQTAALDALTAQAQHGMHAAPMMEKGKVFDLVQKVEAAPSQQRDTRGANINEYKSGSVGYGSKTRLKSAGERARPISQDYLAQ
jgi:hypothetical protein